MSMLTAEQAERAQLTDEGQDSYDHARKGGATHRTAYVQAMTKYGVAEGRIHEMRHGKASPW